MLPDSTSGHAANRTALQLPKTENTPWCDAARNLGRLARPPERIVAESVATVSLFVERRFTRLSSQPGLFRSAVTLEDEGNPILWPFCQPFIKNWATISVGLLRKFETPGKLREKGSETVFEQAFGRRPSALQLPLPTSNCRHKSATA